MLWLQGEQYVEQMFMVGLCVACREQITLSMQNRYSAAFPTHAILWMVIVSPLAKYPLTLSPVAQALEVRVIERVHHGIGGMSLPDPDHAYGQLSFANVPVNMQMSISLAK